MDEQLRRFLDGEGDGSELPPRLREEARRWSALAEDLRAVAPEAPPSLEEHVMREVRSGPAPAAAEEGANALVRGLAWLFRPLSVPVPPALPIAAAAVLALWIAGLPPAAGPEADPEAAGVTASEEGGTTEDRAVALRESRSAEGAAPGAGTARIYVEFSLEAPGAEAVAVAGDFTGWAPSVRLHDRDGDGVWSGRAPLQPGIHEYMFVVDGERWITDPRAERYARDGFGHRNAVLTVAAPSNASRSGT